MHTRTPHVHTKTHTNVRTHRRGLWGGILRVVGITTTVASVAIVTGAAVFAAAALNTVGCVWSVNCDLVCLKLLVLPLCFEVCRLPPVLAVWK